MFDLLWWGVKMAVSFVWPASLPQIVRRDYSEDFGLLVLRTPMDKGPAKQRFIGARPDTMQVAFEMTSTQVEALRSFISDSLKGTARFGFPHPRTTVQVEARIVPQDGGKLFNMTYMSPGKYLVSLSLEIMP